MIVPMNTTPQCQSLALLGPAPCDTCRHAVRCGDTGEACLAFSEYCRGVSEGKWRLMPKQPRTDIGARLGFRLPETA
ncbi:MAG: hypothetical protein ACREIV_17070 [Planctomycetaceae bacterium]